MSSLAEYLNFDPFIFHYVIVPALIFMARIVDVSINTMRIIFMLGGKKMVSSVLGFFESLIWLLAISQIFQNLENVPTYFAYASGFGTGVFVGMWIEEKLAMGFVIVRVITLKPAEELVSYLRDKNYRYTSVDAVSDKGDVNIVFMVTKRSTLDELIKWIKHYNPNAVYTIEGVKRVSDPDIETKASGLLYRLRHKE